MIKGAKGRTRLAIGAAILVASALLLAPKTARAARPFDHGLLARTALVHHIRPGYARLLAATAGLKATLAASCAAPSSVGRQATERAFDTLVDAWGRIEDIQFGPVTEALRLERILFWPDRRGRGRRQIEQAITRRDPTVVDAGGLAKKSVALQGIGALEAVLFGEPQGNKLPLDPYRCRFASAIADNLAGIATELSNAWSDGSPFAKLWLRPGLDNPHYLKGSETTLALAKSLDHGLERVRDLRIAGPLGLNAQRRRTDAVLHLSGRTMLLVAANVAGLQELYGAGGLGAAITATAADESVTGNAELVANELETAQAAARKLVKTARPFQDKKATQRLIAMGFPLKNARVEAAHLLSLTAGLAMGFNATDGD